MCPQQCILVCHILRDPGATGRDDAIFSDERHFWRESLLQGRKSPRALFLTKRVPEVVELRPADWPENIFSGQSTRRSSRVILSPSYTKWFSSSIDLGCFSFQRFRRFRSEFKWKGLFQFLPTGLFGITVGSGGGPLIFVGIFRPNFAVPFLTNPFFALIIWNSEKKQKLARAIPISWSGLIGKCRFIFLRYSHWSLGRFGIMGSTPSCLHWPVQRNDSREEFQKKKIWQSQGNRKP